MRRELFVCGLLVAATLAVYAPLRHHGFLNYDDGDYVYENRHVRAGLTAEGIEWALTTRTGCNWHPLTWLSHMLDCQLFGLEAGFHHSTSVLLHVANTALLFLILQAMTGCLWRCALVAALFALHPFHVESVAWVSERKDVLSTLFWMLTIGAYVFYVRKPAAGRYALVAACFAAGLLAKPMLVTLPLVLLLLDYWPLGRLSFAGSGPEMRRGPSVPITSLIREKIPLFAIAVVSSAVTVFVQRKGGAVATLTGIPLGMRIANALVSYVRYLGKMIWPAHLTVFYPYPISIPPWKPIAATSVLVVMTLVAVRQARARPYFIVGWLWYLVTLLPVIGLVQVGEQSHADRYTYITLTGPFIILAWGVPELFPAGVFRKHAFAAFGGTAVAACAIATWLQVGVWKDNFTLWRHALEVTERNYLAHNNLGVILKRQGDTREAMAHFEEALRIKPDYPEAHSNLGIVLHATGRTEEAEEHLRQALRLKPQVPDAHYNLGIVLQEQGRLAEAAAEYEQAVRAAPDDPDARFNLGAVLTRQGRATEAIAHYEEAVRIDPSLMVARLNLALLLADQGKTNEAIAQYEAAVRIDPNLPEAQFNLGMLLEEQGRIPEAIAHLTEAVRLKPDDAEAREALASLRGRAGRTEEAGPLP